MLQNLIFFFREYSLCYLETNGPKYFLKTSLSKDGWNKRWKQWENDDRLVQVVADYKGDKGTVGTSVVRCMQVLMDSRFCIPVVTCEWLLCAQGRGAWDLWHRFDLQSANSPLHTRTYVLHSLSYTESSSESSYPPPHPDQSFQRALWGL